jgi:hypothetical protein
MQQLTMIYIPDMMLFDIKLLPSLQPIPQRKFGQHRGIVWSIVACDVADLKVLN